jgi:alpha-ribazole phosphatase
VRIVLVRHPAPLIAPGTCYGRLDLPLHPDADIDRLAHDPLLPGSRHVWTSPSRRCRELADRIAEILSVPLSADPRLLELDFGQWEGKPWDNTPRADLDRWAADLLGFRPQGGESGAELVARVKDFRDGLNQDCVVVSHGGPLRVLSALLRGEPVDLLKPSQAVGTMVEFIL